VGYRESPRGRGCFGSVVALPLAVIGIGGVLALVFLRGEPPGGRVVDQFVDATSQPTMVSAFWSHPVVPPASKSFVLEALEEARAEVLDAVRSGPGSTAGEVSATTSAPTGSSTAEDRGRRAGDPRTHRNRPSSSAPLPTANPSGAVVNPSTSASAGTPSSSAPVETGASSSDPVPAPPPPSLSSESSASSVSVPESTPATG
jgi:hypothetical protein